MNPENVNLYNCFVLPTNTSIETLEDSKMDFELYQRLMKGMYDISGGFGMDSTSQDARTQEEKLNDLVLDYLEECI